jgi:hypothetical protein
VGASIALSAGSAAERVELHHRVPRCLIRLRDEADALAGAGSDFDAAAIAAWLDYEFEALRWGVDPDLSRAELERQIHASTVAIPYEDHRGIHRADFARWGRRGGMATLERYGRAWFVALGLRRQGRITRSQLEASALELAGRLS